MTDIQDKIDRAIRLHEEAYHDKQKRWKAPTVNEMLAYQQENPELQGLNIRRLHRIYSDGGWKDTQGKPVRNWKLKLWTLARHQQGTAGMVYRCYKCKGPADMWMTDDTGQREYCCRRCQPKLWEKYPERRLSQ